jgi:hypothetical protein
MKSGAIWNNEKSDLVLNGNVLEAGELAFYFKVSSEEGYDFLRFYIDDVEQNAWSGLQGWQQASFTVAPGYHIFRWTYEKDEIIAANEDAAWVDFVHLPLMEESSQSVLNPQEGMIKVYPNPAQEFITIESTEKLEGTYSIYDMMGRKISSGNLSGGNNMTYTLELDEIISPGLYVLNLSPKYSYLIRVGS